MFITGTKLKNFRNHTDMSAGWGARLNLISGPNGTGKTNTLDGIHYLCMSRSFVANSDQYVVQQGSSSFEIRGSFKGNIRSEFDVSCTYSRGEGKKIFVNDSPLDRLSDLIGMIPVVTLSPDDKKLTAEGPTERRSFIDSFISQLHPGYLRDLIDYRKIIKQRNKLLSNFRMPSDVMEANLEPWDAQLTKIGSRIVVKRAEIAKVFQGYLQEAYKKIARIESRPSFEYKTFCNPSEPYENILEQYQKLLIKNRDKEKDREQTLIGPHRDDLVFYLDDFELRKFGSHGQHRMFALSLKLAQLYYYSDHMEDLPILLLDDVFGDLDPQKILVFLEMLISHPGQIFITAANPEPLLKHIPFDGEERRHFEMKSGLLSEIKE